MELGSMGDPNRRGTVPWWGAALVASAIMVLSGVAALAEEDTGSYDAWWVQTVRETHLWAGEDQEAPSFGPLNQWSYLKVMEPQDGARLHVFDPQTENYAWVNADDVGPSADPFPGMANLDAGLWIGRVAVDGGLVVRSAPSRRAPAVDRVPRGVVLNVREWVRGDMLTSDNVTWAKLDDGRYAHSSGLAAVVPDQPPAPPSDAPRDGKWMDVNLTKQVATAYEGREAVRMMVTSSGRPGWETAPGDFKIQRRVASETMDGRTLQVSDPALRAETDYLLKNVRWTQYFTSSGNALHENYWLSSAGFGIPRSHGCLGLKAGDAQWLWSWASMGTTDLVHY